MAKIDIMHQQLRPVEENVLDIFQIQIISMFDELVNEPDIWKYFQTIAYSEGYCFPFFKDTNGKKKFIGCTPEYVNKHKNPFGENPWQFNFKWDVIFHCKRILTRWHNKHIMRPGHWDNERRKRIDDEQYILKLSKKQRGILTKILKAEKHRQKLLKQGLQLFKCD